MLLVERVRDTRSPSRQLIGKAKELCEWAGISIETGRELCKSGKGEGRRSRRLLRFRTPCVMAK